MKYETGQVISVRCLRTDGSITVGKNYTARVCGEVMFTGIPIIELTNDFDLSQKWQLLTNWFKVQLDDDLEPAMS